MLEIKNKNHKGAVLSKYLETFQNSGYILEYEDAISLIKLHHVDRVQDNFKIKEGSLILKMIPPRGKIDGWWVFRSRRWWRHGRDI